MKKLAYIFAAFSLFLAIWATSPVAAQCPMCKAAVVSGDKGNPGERAKGLNTGILYLFVLPYLAIGTIGYFWYKSNKKRKAREADEEAGSA